MVEQGDWGLRPETHPWLIEEQQLQQSPSIANTSHISARGWDLAWAPEQWLDPVC